MLATLRPANRCSKIHRTCSAVAGSGSSRESPSSCRLRAVGVRAGVHQPIPVGWSTTQVPALRFRLRPHGRRRPEPGTGNLPLRPDPGDQLFRRVPLPPPRRGPILSVHCRHPPVEREPQPRHLGGEPTRPDPPYSCRPSGERTRLGSGRRPDSCVCPVGRDTPAVRHGCRGTRLGGRRALSLCSSPIRVTAVDSAGSVSWVNLTLTVFRAVFIDRRRGHLLALCWPAARIRPGLSWQAWLSPLIVTAVRVAAGLPHGYLSLLATDVASGLVIGRPPGPLPVRMVSARPRCLFGGWRR